MVLWNLVGQAVRYGAKGAAAFSQSETGKRLKNAVDPPAVVGVDLALLERKAKALGGVLGGLDTEAERQHLLELAGAEADKAERKVRRWANGSSIVFDNEVAQAVLNVLPFLADAFGTSAFTSASLTAAAREVLRPVPHLLAVVDLLDRDAMTGLRFVEAFEANDIDRAGQMIRNLAGKVFPF